MSPLCAIAITTGILSGLWSWLAASTGLVAWAGFLGCTSYFASAGGAKALGQTMACNLAGLGWGMLLLHSGVLWGNGSAAHIATAIVATLMCLQARWPGFAFIPATFVGCCTAFAGTGDWPRLATSLLVGALFGWAMKASGLWLAQRTQ